MELDGEAFQELLSGPQALERIQSARKRLAHEKALIDSQLEAGISRQVHTLADGLSAVQDIKTEVAALRSTMAEMSNTYEESLPNVPGFDDTQRLATILTNFELTQKFVAHFRALPQQLEKVQRLVDADGAFDVENPMPNLLSAHYLLSELRRVREEAAVYLNLKDVTSDTRVTVRKLYEPLDTVTAQFDANIWSIAEDILEPLRCGNKSLVVRAAKVVEAEEKHDFIMQVRSGRTKPESAYLKRFFNAIEMSVSQQFDNCMAEFKPDTDPSELLQNLGFGNSELLCCQTELAPCCPARWQIFHKFVKWYHKGVHRSLNAIMQFEPPAAILLQTLRFVKQYYVTMNQAFHINKKTDTELLQPPLLDGKEQELYTDYLNMIVKKLKEWYGNIWEIERKEFLEGSLHPEYHANGVGLESHTTITKLINQQLDVAAESGQAKVIAGCVDACCEIVELRQRQWVDLMRAATKKELRGDPDAPKGLYEYIFVVANDQDRAYAFIELLTPKWSEPVPVKYQGQILTRFEEAKEGFQNVTKECFLCNLKIVFSDTQPAFAQIFQSESWYSGATIKAIIDTFADFVEDARRLLMPDLFEIFLGKLCTDTILHYLRAMRLSPSSSSVGGAGGNGQFSSSSSDGQKKLNMPRGKQRIISDAKALFEFFTKPDYGLDSETVTKVFYVFDLFCDVQDAPFEELPALFRELRSNERDAPVDLFEAMLSLRLDVDQKLLRQLMGEVRAVAVHAEPLVEKTDGEVVEQEHSFLYEFNKA